MIANPKSSQYILILFFFVTWCWCQNKETKTPYSPPLSAEVMVGTDHVFFQTIVNKPISNDGKLGYSFVTALNTEYKVGDESKQVDLMVPIALNYKFYKGIALNAGFAMNPAFGNRPFVGFRYVKANDTWVVVVVPSLYVADHSYYESLASLEYTPKISKNLKLYSRLQGLYSFETSTGAHDRSYVYLRFGLNASKFAFGLGYNWDSYGPYKVLKSNVGLFLKSTLF
ncbi:DUF481 domain-containing protein [Flavobacterium aciduliphilum]|nr:DUF481 domain-containing protein [Flavobacterium aciduliphilum]